jgi:CrcB protein
VGSLISRVYPSPFPLGTFLVNVTGSFLIGVLMTFFLNRPTLDANWRLFFVTGVLGGYTTFSSFEWEALTTLRGGAGSIALLYIFASVLLGLASAWLGLIAGNKLWPR